MANNKKQMLLNFYEHVLTALGCVITSDGMVSNKETGEPVTTLSGERLVMPTDDRLSKLAGSNTVAFHPMSENVILGQSEVIRLTRQLVNESITHKVLVSMLGIATAIAGGVEFKSAQITKLTTVSDIDEKTVKALTKLTQNIDHTSPQRVVNVYLKHGGSIEENSFKRTAFVSWPLYDELVSVCNDNGDTVYGISMRKKDVVLIRSLFELLIPHAGEQDYYSAGSNSKAAPYFHALLSAFANVVGDLNGMTWIFRKVIFDAVSQTPHVTLDFIDEFGEGDAYRDIIPPLDKNQGNRPTGATNDAQVVQNQQQMPQQPQVQQPQQQQQVQQQQQPYQHQQTPIYQQPIQQPVYQQQPQQQQRWTGPTIGANTGPATGITKDGQAATNNQSTVVQTQQDMMNLAYPPSVYPHLYMQPQMAIPQYPQFGGNVQMMQPQLQQPQFQQPMQTMGQFPQYQQNAMMQPMAQMNMMMPQNVMQQQQMQQQQPVSLYPKFNRAT